MGPQSHRAWWSTMSRRRRRSQTAEAQAQAAHLGSRAGHPPSLRRRSRHLAPGADRRAPGAAGHADRRLGFALDGVRRGRRVRHRHGRYRHRAGAGDRPDLAAGARDGPRAGPGPAPAGRDGQGPRAVYRARAARRRRDLSDDRMARRRCLEHRRSHHAHHAVDRGRRQGRHRSTHRRGGSRS